MNIQEAIKSKKPFRRLGWMNNIFVVYTAHDIVLTLESDPLTSIELDVQDILADDWYTRDEIYASYEFPNQVLNQPMPSRGRESAK